MDLWVATTNQGKLSEFKSLMEQQGVIIHSPKELKSYFPPKETGATFEDNARLKSRSMKVMKSGVWVLGEDSGLEAEGLGGLPGIHSARYAGEKAGDAENCAKLLKMMQIRAGDNRKAVFRCTIVAYSPEGIEHVIQGEMSGTIASKASGTVGFGYDPVFIPEGETKTLAELGLAVKNRISHRANAIRTLLALMNNK